MNTYKARQGDVIWLNFSPQSGREQKGIIVSNNSFNEFMKCAAMVCPITSNNKGIPLQVVLSDQNKTTGVIMCDQAKILDLTERNPEFIETISPETLLEISDIIAGFVEVDETDERPSAQSAGRQID
jgi:mRNA interferase MazF